MPAKGLTENPYFKVLQDAGFSEAVVKEVLKAPSSSKTSAAIEERRAAIAALLKSGMSQRDIVTALANRRPTPIVASLGTVNTDIRVIFARWHLAQINGAAEARLLDLARLDDALRGITVEYRGGNLQAIDRLIKIVEQRGEILGYKAARKMELTGKDGEPLNDAEDIAGKLAERLAALVESGRAAEVRPES